jgi:hypothetical protein
MIIADYAIEPDLVTAEDSAYWGDTLYAGMMNLVKLYARLQHTYYDKALYGLRAYVSESIRLYENVASGSAAELKLLATSDMIGERNIDDIWHPPRYLLIIHDYFQRAKGKKTSAAPNITEWREILFTVDDMNKSIIAYSKKVPRSPLTYILNKTNIELMRYRRNTITELTKWNAKTNKISTFILDNEPTVAD